MGGKGGREKYITERNGKAPENGKESLNSAHANGMNESSGSGIWGYGLDRSGS